MGCYWFLKFPVADVTAVSIEADVERVLRLFHVLQLALPALDEVDDVPDFASCCRSYVEGTACGDVCESVFSQDVLAGLAPRVATRTASFGLVVVR